MIIIIIVNIKSWSAKVERKVKLELKHAWSDGYVGLC